MDNEKNTGTERGAEKKEDSSSDAANRARNRTVMLTPEVTGQVRALLNQERPSDMFGRDSREANKGDDFAPVLNSPNPVTGLISRDGIKESPVPKGGYGQVESRPSAATGAPIDPQLIHAARQNTNTVGVISEKLTAIVGFLVSFDNHSAGEVLELRSGRWIVSSERTSDGNFLIVKDGSVSPLHAILKISDAGEIQVLDQLSEHGTAIKHANGEEEQLSGSMGQIEHGDMIAFGERNFHVCLIQKG